MKDTNLLTIALPESAIAYLKQQAQLQGTSAERHAAGILTQTCSRPEWSDVANATQAWPTQDQRTSLLNLEHRARRISADRVVPGWRQVLAAVISDRASSMVSYADLYDQAAALDLINRGHLVLDAAEAGKEADGA
ncbi:MAG: hypothetical protein D3X82_16785 [Candidatus Leucobacter sulfamidivorax]|nr:hypothetical protein [Candidatus Leucobacter sulfamidivorax]